MGDSMKLKRKRLAFDYYVLEYLEDNVNKTTKRMFLSDFYEKFCSLHRLPKKVVREALLDLQDLGKVEVHSRVCSGYVLVL